LAETVILNSKILQPGKIYEKGEKKRETGKILNNPEKVAEHLVMVTGRRT